MKDALDVIRAETVRRSLLRELLEALTRLQRVEVLAEHVGERALQRWAIRAGQEATERVRLLERARTRTAARA